MIKVLQDITRQEWVAYRWIEIPPVMGDDDDRSFRTDGRRTPDESYQAMEEWDMTAEERDIEPEEEKGSIQ
jgi:hypothetical protein